MVDQIRLIEARDPSHVERMKPSPYLVQRAGEALSLPLSECVLIGDQVSDVAAAKAAGARSIGYANKPGKAEDLANAGADAVIDDMAHLAALLDLVR
jgi:phosphoglycolate phosphatase